MTVLILFTIIGVITTLTGLFFFGLRVYESIVVELDTFKYRVSKLIEIRKEAVDKSIELKKQRDSKVEVKSNELADIKAAQKVDKVKRKILLEKTKNTSKSKQINPKAIDEVVEPRVIEEVETEE